MEIILDQIGFRLNDEKRAVFRGGEPKSFHVVDSGGTVVYTQQNLKRMENTSAGEIDFVGDFSEVNSAGIYRIQTEDMVTSHPFSISEEVYDEVTVDLLRMFYLQRCGMELTAEYAGDFAHGKCHASIATVWDTDRKIDVTGGWHDAGDYGRYIVAAAASVADLMLAYERNPQRFQTSLQIPESGNGVPDILNETRYELTWMFKMQDETTGEVYHKVTCYGFPGFVMPEEEIEPLIVFGTSVTATATFAAAMAMAQRFFAPYDAKFAEQCLNASVCAYDALKKMNQPGGFHNPEGVVTGEYGDDCDTDERYWAAAELYRATGDKRYRDDFEALYHEKVKMGYGWTEVGSYGSLAYLETTYDKDADIERNIREGMIALADRLIDASEKDSYGVSMEGGYIWGSNMVVANNGMHLCDAYRLTGDEKYLNIARRQVHYLFGLNPMNLCYVTGHGACAPQNPHHRPSAALGKPMKGMLVGGPDSELHDETAARELAGVSAAKCYIDELESYSTNEITIYWNAPLITLLAQI